MARNPMGRPEDDIDAMFAMGCLHFGLKDAPRDLGPDALETVAELMRDQKYLNDIREALEAMPSVDGINVQAEAFSILLPGDLPGIPHVSPLGSGIGCYPHVDPLTIDFDLQLPTRVQDTLAPRAKEPWPDRWRVHFRSAQRLPIVFVRPLVVTPDLRSSLGVVIVREFLQSQASILAEHGLELDALGPSPFHAECALRGVDEELEDPGYICQYEQQRGYSPILFTYSRDVFPRIGEALEAIWANLKDELGLYYLAVQVRTLRELGSDEVRESVGQLVSRQTEGGIRGIWKRTFVGTGLNSAFLSVAQHQDQILITRRLLQDSRREIYATIDAKCLEQVVDQEIADSETTAVTHFNDLAALFEARRSTNLGLVSIVISSVIGGAIGAILTAILTA